MFLLCMSVLPHFLHQVFSTFYFVEFCTTEFGLAIFANPEMILQQYEARPRNLRSYFLVVSNIPFTTFRSSAWTPFLSTTCANISTLGCMKEHFLILNLNPLSFKIRNTFSRWIACSKALFEIITTSSQYHRTLSTFKKTLSVTLWNVACEFISTNGVTLNWNVPYLCTNAASCL